MKTLDISGMGEATIEAVTTILEDFSKDKNLVWKINIGENRIDINGKDSELIKEIYFSGFIEYEI